MTITLDCPYDSTNPGDYLWPFDNGFEPPLRTVSDCCGMRPSDLFYSICIDEYPDGGGACCNRGFCHEVQYGWQCCDRDCHGADEDHFQFYPGETCGINDGPGMSQPPCSTRGACCFDADTRREFIGNNGHTDGPILFRFKDEPSNIGCTNQLDEAYCHSMVEAASFTPSEFCQDAGVCLDEGACCSAGDLCDRQACEDDVLGVACRRDGGIPKNAQRCDSNPCDLIACCMCGESCRELPRGTCEALHGVVHPGDCSDANECATDTMHHPCETEIFAPARRLEIHLAGSETLDSHYEIASVEPFAATNTRPHPSIPYHQFVHYSDKVRQQYGQVAKRPDGRFSLAFCYDDVRFSDIINEDRISDGPVFFQDAQNVAGARTIPNGRALFSAGVQCSCGDNPCT